ncbi:MAG: PIN domain-containing protein [Casimicrobiaceae bacterium]|nr:PIN domain-containing protein [Casimicrobiaceae bacterium]MCX8098446.1 PIN domain-containing protein [Casimicrobiaceae bacterium]MDW8311158.1 PIN domain-containing protein [Burkholderiales bacterium]
MSAFLDTNILVYCFDAREADKQARASALVERLLAGDEPVWISTQVAIEFLHWSRRSGADMLARERRREALTLFRCQATTLDTVQAAWLLAAREQLAWFDALIVQAALEARAATLYSEELAHGRRYGALEVRNPFLG